MLSTLSTTSSRLSWRASALLAAIAIGAFASPLLYLSRATLAQAADPKEEATARPGEPAVEYLPKLTPVEETILLALEKPTTFDFREMPLQHVLDFLKDKHSIEIQLDGKALEDAGMGSDTPVTRKVSGVSLRSGLRLLLSQIDLASLIHDEVLLVTTKEVAEAELVTRTYPVADLTPGDKYDSLINAVTTAVGPNTWSEVGGPGSVSSVPASKSLVISQTQDVQDKVLTLLRSLRAARKSAAVEK